MIAQTACFLGDLPGDGDPLTGDDSLTAELTIVF